VVNVCLTKSEKRKHCVFVLVCAALEDINTPRDIVFPNEVYAPPRTHNCPLPRSVVSFGGLACDLSVAGDSYPIPSTAS